MTEANLNETINGYRGSIGKLVFKKYKGRTIVARKGVSSKPPTQPQIDQRVDFKDASDFAKSVKANPDLLAFYAPIARQRDISLRALAMGDYLKKPAIKPLNLDNYKGRIGDVITIRAEDDLGLAELNVKIVAQDGTPIESGPAVEEGERSGKWLYTATKAVAMGTDVFIELRGADHAGNKCQWTENPTVGAEE